MSASGYIHIEATLIKRETDAAFLLVLGVDEEGDQVEVWMPKSQMSDPNDYSEGDENVTVSITEWIAEQKGLI